MVSRDQYYPDHLNPFGSDEEEDKSHSPELPKATITVSINPEDYPDYLSPFGDDIDTSEVNPVTNDDYDESLNPFGDDTSEQHSPVDQLKECEKRDDRDLNKVDNIVKNNSPEEDELKSATSQHHESTRSASCNKEIESQPASLDCPPVPLPRTKSLLKKELAQKNKQPNTQSRNENQAPLKANHSLASISIQNHNQSGSDNDKPGSASANPPFQRKKNKRNAPPVPINFKRQVFGSVNEIENELNNIGDELEELEKNFLSCQASLKESHDTDPHRFSKSRSEMVEILEKKNSISRRQKELMYRKRELKLDQIHSDIEYELRMIGNKQRKYFHRNKQEVNVPRDLRF